MPILDPYTLEIFSRSPSQTKRIGIRLGAMLQTGDLVCLSGDLGSGKTTLVQGVAQGWGSADQVTSPTFVIVNIYRRFNGHNLHHLDAYRLQSGMEALELDLEGMLENGSLIIEWAERIKSVLPGEHLWVDMRWIDLEQRHMIFNPRGKRYRDMMQEFRKQVYGG